MPKNLRTPEQILRHAKRLEPGQIHDLAWKLMDMAGIVLFAGVSVSDIREDIEEDDEDELHDVEITDEQILDAISEAAEGDYSEWFSQAKADAMEHLRKELGLDDEDGAGEGDPVDDEN